MGISEATFYNWKKKFVGLGVTELRRLRQLEDENQLLKKPWVDLSLDKEMLQEILKQSSEAGSEASGGAFSAGGLPSISVSDGKAGLLTTRKHTGSIVWKD